MSLESDLLLGRQRARRKLVLWRGFAILLFFAVIAIGGVSYKGKNSQEDHLVKVKITGIIGTSDALEEVKLIDSALKDKSVKGMILSINSPGGVVTGGEQLHDAVARFASKKTVVVTMGSVAASAGYMIAVPAKRIFAFNSTLTGSIGVLMQAPDVSNLLNKVGITVDQLVSGPLKGQPSMVKPLSPAGKEMLQGVIAELYGQFVGMVAQGRHMDINRVKSLADGRPYTGSQAVKLGLVDQIGTEDDATQWLIHHDHLKVTIPIIELKKDKNLKWLSDFTGESMENIFKSLWSHIFFKNTLPLDGAVAIWQP